MSIPYECYVQLHMIICVQLNEYEINLYYLKLSQHITTDGLLIYCFFSVLTVFECCDLKVEKI
jgi:hypothetical protein